MITVRLSCFIVLAGALAGCGSDALVGGQCRSGLVEKDGSCVPAPSGPGAPASTSPVAETNDTSPTLDPAIPPVVEPPPPVVEPPPPVVEPPPPVIEPPPPLTCEAPLAACRGECIPVDSDPQNCGACGRVCASNICAAGVCQGATPGDVVLIGHDMRNMWAYSAHARVLVNAVSIATTDPIRILSYEDGSDTSSAAWARWVIAHNITNRGVSFTTATEASILNPNLYGTFDVVLVHGAAVPDPSALGATWASSLGTFTKKGGVFIGIDNGETDMPAFVAATGLLPITGHEPLPSTTHFAVTSASDIVATQVLSPYAAFGSSTAFHGVPAPTSDLVWVVRTNDDSALPTVIHRVVR